ncbi:hypothetical protein AMTRI_Chr11g153530 [Amborella trichopoda]|uniref:Myb/SANT-like domain-containing protein n=1 Tax=Amborella trichopoda TaxID=13333 RepID=U5D581_AMBTC|nr:uncharacterized protein At2g29880 [Amborella trichopoda]XP_020529599.1 uncharacterized protein At2g29880 [Amborella trichopoda]XP_020529600.1 uncharacterized protein At2g29880 [Amborella trichopoda]XP_020529601.1 uncharacterized protein At2g29880 [Amborella trichopoda]XP_020529603.1 uncharacterized protein At2g29880 [Amborella trichopoda]XP_020529604.1 uncharacterized protein At2g29880 [Amborella trichopoda]XP_020529605.1 uncharacterized protein At2g29880 [Amborella trichopoda]XP_02052960|eukprot:XP_006855095.1 uncharacterized protein At2g29880 [Amborella trichopoda]
MGTHRRSNGTAERRRLEWNPYWDEYFVVLMVNQVNKGKKRESGFSKDAWRSMVIKFNRKFNQTLHKQHLKHRYQYLKREYKIVKTLLDQTGFAWDERRKIVTAKTEAWDCYLSEHPEAKLYRTRGLPLMGELGIIFGNSTADNQQNHHGEKMEEAPRVRRALQPPVIFTDDDVATLDSESDESSCSREDMNALDQGNKRKFEILSPSHCDKKARKMDKLMVEALQEMADSLRFRTSRTVGPSSKQELKNCIEELQAMKDLDDQLFGKACKMLKDEKNAVIFMTLKGHHRLLWVNEMCVAL